MTSDEMFLNFRKMSPSSCDYTECLFSEYLIRKPEITRIALSQRLFEMTGEEIPSAGEIQAVCDRSGNCVYLIRIRNVKIMSGKSVDCGIPFYPENDESLLYCVLDFSIVFQ